MSLCRSEQRREYRSEREGKRKSEGWNNDKSQCGGDHRGVIVEVNTGGLRGGVNKCK